MRLDLLACPSLSLFRHHPVRHLQGWAGLQTRYCLWHQGLSDQRHTGNTKDALSPQSSFWHTCEMRTHEPQGNTSINPGLLAELWERSFGSGPTQQTRLAQSPMTKHTFTGVSLDCILLHICFYLNCFWKAFMMMSQPKAIRPVKDVPSAPRWSSNTQSLML